MRVLPDIVSPIALEDLFWCGLRWNFKIDLALSHKTTFTIKAHRELAWKAAVLRFDEETKGVVEFLKDIRYLIIPVGDPRQFSCLEEQPAFKEVTNIVFRGPVIHLIKNKGP